MQHKFFTLLFSALTLGTAFVSCNDDTEDPVTPDKTDSTKTVTTDTTKTTPSADTTNVTPVPEPDPDPAKVSQFKIAFNGIDYEVTVDSASALKDYYAKAIEQSKADYKILSATLNGENLTEDLIAKTVVNKDITVEVKAIKLTKHPTLEQLKQQNYTDVIGSTYFDFKNMKCYTVEDGKVVYTSNIDYNEETGKADFTQYMVNAKMELDCSWELILVDGKIYKVADTYVKSDGSDSFFGEYKGSRDEIAFTDDYKFYGGYYTLEDNISYEFQGAKIIANVSEYFTNDYVYNGKDIIYFADKFDATTDPAPSTDGTTN